MLEELLAFSLSFQSRNIFQSVNRWMIFSLITSKKLEGMFCTVRCYSDSVKYAHIKNVQIFMR